MTLIFIRVKPLLLASVFLSMSHLWAEPSGSATASTTFGLPDGRSLPWSLTMAEGGEGNAANPKSVVNEGSEQRYDFGQYGVVVSRAMSERGYEEIVVRISNKTDQELWLEPGISINVPGSDFEWFDGYQSRKIFSRRETLVGTLPFVSYQHGNEGVALGIDPRQLVSHFRGSLKKQADDQGGLEFSSRLVLPPKGEEIRRFVMFSYQPDFGYLNAVQEYWKFFPETYKAHTGVCPGVKGTVLGNIVWMNQHFQYHDGPKGKYNDKVSEVVRWVGGGWEWCYAGYGARPGDWLCTEETTFDWKVNPKDPKSPDKTTALRDVLGRSAKEHLEGLLGNYRRLEALGVASLMYIIPSYCESELAEKKYSDSIYYDPQGKPRTSGPPWVGPYDRSYQMYCYGNRFGDYTTDAIKIIAERTPGLRGFSFDCIDRANFNYTGPGLERSPGKAYDQKLGGYVNTEIAHAKFGEAVHQLEKDGYRLALTGNFRASGGSYLSAQAMDAAVIEHTPWDERPLPNVIRLNVGTKSVSFLHGYERVPDIEKLSAEELIKTARTLQDFTILQSLRYGIYPSWKSTLGSPKMIYYFGIFNDLYRKYGWQPAPGAKGDGDLWISRYGDAPGSILSVGNATEREISSSLEILPTYFGGKSVAFVDYEGGEPVETKLAQGRQRIETKLAPGSALLLASAVAWQEAFDGSVVGRREQIVGKRVTDYIDIVPQAEDGCKIKAFWPGRPGYEISAVRFDSNDLPFQKDASGVSFEHPLRKGSLAIEYRPTVGTSKAEALSKIEFLNKEKHPTFQIVLLNDTLATRLEATRINSFFNAYTHGLDNVDGVSNAQVYSKAEEPATDRMTIYIGVGEARVNSPFKDEKSAFTKGEIAMQKDAIGLFGEDDKHLADAGDLFLKILAKAYPHYGRFHISSKSIPGGAGVFSPSLFQKVTGMDYLPWEKDGKSNGL